MIHNAIRSKLSPVLNEPYSPAIKAGDFIYISAQLPLSSSHAVGHTIQDETKQCLENMNALLKEAGIDLSYVLHTTVYLKNMDDLKEMDTVYAGYFKKPYPARTVVGVQELDGDALIAIEGFAIDTRALDILCAEEKEGCTDKCCGL